MTASRRVTVICSLVLLMCLPASVLISRRLDQVRSGAALQEMLYISAPKVLRRLSLGYNGLLADVYWTRTVQYFGSKHYAGAQEYHLLAPLLQITTALDPQLTIAYEFGANFLAPDPPNGAGMPQEAVRLAEFGIRNNPDDWKLYYNLGFIYYMELNDYKDAANAFERGAKVPNANPLLKVMAGMMAERAGEVKTARFMWVTTYQTTQDPSVKANAVAHLRALQVDEDITKLDALISDYRGKTGHLPESFSDLESKAMLKGVPTDPLGQPYELTPDGQVEVRDPDDLPFITRGTPPGYKPPAKPKFLPSD